MSTSPEIIETKRPSSDYAIAGAASGFLTRFICQPLDVIKIRFQLQVEPISHNHSSKYRSFLQATSTIVKEEGVSALWKGHVPAQILSISYGMIQFYCYNECMELLTRMERFNHWQHSVEFVAGASAGTIATIGSFPFDIARTRLVAQPSAHKIYNGFISFYVLILRTESVKSLFRGLSPTLLQVAPHTGLQFVFYNIFRDIYKSLSEESKITATNSMVAGSLAGIFAKTVVYPLDLARKRMQIQGFEHGRQGFGKFFSCRGLIDCLIRTVKEEGILGLFKGLFPSQLKAASASAFHFTFYEQTLFLLRHIRL
ncbi:hypothetical protein PV326_005217 [Microctonus aethiopoides]|nr:hypothetical protein PV326_005217 [Microctonus aethiopoides]